MSKVLNTSKQNNARNERLAYHEILVSIDTDWKVLNDVLTDRSTPFQVDLSYRVKSSWDKYGLIDTDRENLEWRRFSLIDAFWINIIKKLRAFGYPLQAIHTLKNKLEKVKKQSDLPIHILAFATIYILDTKHTLLLHVFETGDFTLVMPRDSKTKVKGDSICINLNKILQTILPTYDFGYRNLVTNDNTVNESETNKRIMHGVDELIESMRTANRKGEEKNG